MTKFKFVIIFLTVSISSLCKAQGSEEGAPISIKITPNTSIAGRTVKVTGTTLVAKAAVDLQLSISNPKGVVQNVVVKTDTKGNYATTFSKTMEPGWYSIKIITADKKNSVTDSLYIRTINGLTNSFAGQLAKFTETAQAASILVDEKTNGLPTSPDMAKFKEEAQQLKKKMNELRGKVDESTEALAKTIKEMSDVPKVMEKTDDYLKQMDDWSEEGADNIASLQKQLAVSKSKATTCENINNITELIGAISFCLNFQGKFLQICTNLASDKLLPGLVDRQSWNGDNAIVEAKKITINEAQKVLTAKMQGSSAMVDFIMKGMVMDMAQFAGKVLYAQMCAEIKGPVNTSFSAVFDADNGAKYWTYDLNLHGYLTLRYDKKASLDKPTAVTGEFEGVRTGYKFWEDFEQVEKVPKGMVLYSRIKKMPLPIDLSSVSGDLGMVARNMVPGSYRVKVKGQIVNNKLTLEFDDSPFDAIESARKESNKLFVICVNPILPIPMIKRFDFPIAPSKAILLHALGKTHEFTLTKAGDKVSIKDNVGNKKELSNNTVHLSTSVSLGLTN